MIPFLLVVATPETQTPQQQLPSPTVAQSIMRLARSDSSTSLLSMFGSLGTPVMRIPSTNSNKAHSLPQTSRNGNRDTFAFSDHEVYYLYFFDDQLVLISIYFLVERLSTAKSKDKDWFCCCVNTRTYQQ